MGPDVATYKDFPLTVEVIDVEVVSQRERAGGPTVNETILAPLLEQVCLTGDLGVDVPEFLIKCGFVETAEHCKRVALEAEKLAARFAVQPSSAYSAGLLHDVSAVFPNSDRLWVAESLEVDVLPEEEQYPLLVHQKISRVMALKMFGVTDNEILSSIGCHTTLKANASSLDLVLFVADKISWDQSGVPPYLATLQDQLNVSLEHSAFAYIQYLWNRRDNLRVVHPWLRDAYDDLSQRLTESV
jgi:predicted HD superfamily hydrolase involved in NAD metabolism